MVFRMEKITNRLNSMQAKWILVFFVLLFAYGAVGGTAHAELGRIDAAIDGQSQYAGKAYFFEGDQYVRYDWAADKVDPGYPKSIAEWNLPGGFTGGFDTVLNGGGPYSGKAYFFKGDQYVRYDWAAEKDDPGYPLRIGINGNWNGLPSVFLGGFDAAVNGQGQYMGKAYFFKGDQYVRYDWAADKADPGYPKPIAGNWDGITVD